jgi:hypothetical protein
MKFLTYSYDLYSRQTTYISLCLNTIYGRMKFISIIYFSLLTNNIRYIQREKSEMIKIIIYKYSKTCQTLLCFLLINKQRIFLYIHNNVLTARFIKKRYKRLQGRWPIQLDGCCRHSYGLISRYLTWLVTRKRELSIYYVKDVSG